MYISMNVKYFQPKIKIKTQINKLRLRQRHCHFSAKLVFFIKLSRKQKLGSFFIFLQSFYRQLLDLQLFYKVYKMQKDKSTNLHDFEYQLFLGFLSQQPLQKAQYDMSFVGGLPLWLNQPNEKLLTCLQCQSENQNLTFLGQIFCPLNATHCYNRIVYVFFCEKCRRCIRCLKQQTGKNWQSKQIKTIVAIKSICPQSFQIQSDPLQKKQFIKIINRSKTQVQEQIIMEEQAQDDDDEEGEQVVHTQKMTGQQFMKKCQELQQNAKLAKQNKEYSDKEVEDINKKFEQLTTKQDRDDKDEKENQLKKVVKDHLFEQYKKVIKIINDPVLIYSNIALPYNFTVLNPRHTCKFCNSKLELEIQITEKVLLFHKNLALLDWGSIFIYACTASCQQSQQQCVIVQYQLDAINEQQIAKLKKTKKTRNKKKRKTLSKQKKRKQENNKIQPEIVKLSDQQETQEKQEEGDWD